MNILDKLGLYTFSLLLLCIGFSTHLSISISTASFLDSLKLPLLLFYIVIIFLSVIKKDLKSLIYPLGLSLLFPVFFLLINVFFKKNINIKVVTMYFLWSIFVFYLIPLWVDSTYRLQSLMKMFLFTATSIVFIAIILSSLNGGYLTTMADRESYGFQNPNYYSQYLQISMFSLYVLLIQGLNTGKIKLKLYSKVIIFSFFILFLFFCFEAKSRNVIIGVFGFLIWCLSYNLQQSSRYVLRGSLVIVCIGILVSLDYTVANNASSGRLEVWSFYIFHTLQSQEFGLLFGAYTYPDVSDLVVTYNRLDSVGEGKFHADNLFIELFVEAGLVGVFLFFLPIIYLFFRRKNTGRSRQIWTALVFSLLLQALFVTNYSSFFSPISLFYASIIMSSLYFTKNNNRISNLS